MHQWGDDWEHWDELYATEQKIRKTVWFWTRCRLISKEKYGTIRYEFILPPGGKFFYPKKYYKVLNWWNSSKLFHWWCKLGWKFTLWTVLKTAKKKPYLADELLEDLASNEELVGEELHKKYWTSL